MNPDQMPTDKDSPYETRMKAVNDVLEERLRQDAKWGEQNHDPFCYLTVLVEEVGEFAQAALHRFFGGRAAENLRTEAIHVAAVALAIVECIDRGKWAWPMRGTCASEPCSYCGGGGVVNSTAPGESAPCPRCRP